MEAGNEMLMGIRLAHKAPYTWADLLPVTSPKRRSIKSMSTRLPYILYVRERFVPLFVTSLPPVYTRELSLI